jgi:hypothetical protein
MQSHALAIAVALAATNAAPAHGQSERSGLGKLQSTARAERRAEFYSLLSSSDSGAKSLDLAARVQRFAAYTARHPDMRRGIIALLENENAHPAEQISEDRYHGDLIATVAGFKDPGAVNALLGAINTGELATRGLALLGDAAVPATLAVAENPSSPSRVASLLTLGDMVTVTPAPPVSAANRARIHDVLLAALADPNRFARQAALLGLSAFHDSATRAAIARIAATDPFTVHDRGETRYPVREAAAAALRKL